MERASTNAKRLPGQALGLRDTLKRVAEAPWFGVAVTAVIIINAATLGLETWPAAMRVAGPTLIAIDQVALLVFTAELALKLFVYRRGFFRDGWNIFDLVVVAVAWIPSSGPLSVLRALRVLRVLRLVSIVPQLRAVVGALISALPGMGSIVAVLLLVFYVAAVMATKLFGAVFPDWFGTIGASMYSLFQIMTLESWSMGIVRPVMEEYPFAWAFFVPFIVVTSFAVLNLFIALIVNSMQSAHAVDREAAEAEARLAHDERESLSRQIEAMRNELREMRTELREKI
jgi:voltage-gated sodium channel